MQPWEKERGQGFYDVVFDRRYGGDLLGVIDKLGYLKELGVDVIYFNPVFEAPSLHKYDASSYHHIDNNFGRAREGDWRVIQNETDDPESWTFTSADSVFLELVQKAHALNIRVVIDGVFNHCGREFWAFQDLLRKQEASRYKGWFDVVRWDDPATPDTNEFDYKSYWGYKSLPEFSENENGPVPPVRNYLFNITRRWMDPNGDGDPSDGIDGWRLDAPNEVNPRLWVDWQKLVKSINPAAITVGEIWDEAADWVGGKRFDIVMNYQFAITVVDFFADRKTQLSVSAFEQELARIRGIYSRETNLIMMNLVAGHDTDRLASMIMNPDRNYDRQAGVRDNPQYDPTKPSERARKIQRLAVLFQMTYVGGPMVYYGDEAGMWGGDDPDDRKPMVWPDLRYEDETYESVLPDVHVRDTVKFDSELFAYYQKLIALRHRYAPLRLGDFETKVVDDGHGILAFARRFGDDEIVVVLHNAGGVVSTAIKTDWPDGSKVSDLLAGKEFYLNDGKIKLTLGAYKAALLARE